MLDVVLFVCDSFTVIENELPFRDPRVRENYGIPFVDRDASFAVQIVAKHHPGYTKNLMVPLKRDYELPANVSEKFDLTAADKMLTEKRSAISWLPAGVAASSRRDPPDRTTLGSPYLQHDQRPRLSCPRCTSWATMQPTPLQGALQRARTSTR
jgi:hypothetical protein